MPLRTTHDLKMSKESILIKGLLLGGTLVQLYRYFAQRAVVSTLSKYVGKDSVDEVLESLSNIELGSSECKNLFWLEKGTFINHGRLATKFLLHVQRWIKIYLN